MRYILIQKNAHVNMALSQLSMGKIKVPHLITGGVISFLTSIIINLAFAHYGWNSEWLVWINIGIFAIPIVLGIHHKKKGKHIRHSTLVCLTSGHGIAFTIFLNYVQEEIIPLILENINQIR